MERIGDIKPSGLSRQALRTWGLLCAMLGVISRGILQNRMLGLSNVTSDQLLEILGATDSAMTIATVALVLQILETCAAPIFAFLLVDGCRHTSDLTKYMIRVAGVAVLSELPYNLALSGKVLDFSSRNPVFALVLALVMVHFWQRYPGKALKHVAIKVLVFLAAFLWSAMLKIEVGGCLLLIVAALWLGRNKPSLQNLFGATAAMLCSLSSPFYLASPMAFLMIHFHNGEPGTSNRVLNYLAYPVLLLAVGLAGIFLL